MYCFNFLKKLNKDIKLCCAYQLQENYQNTMICIKNQQLIFMMHLTAYLIDFI